jgi:hypothetical protein
MILKTSLVLGLVVLVSMVAPVLAAFTPDWYTKGYVEAAAKPPMSSSNANYTQGYKNAIADDFGIPVKIPTHNLKDFYQGIHKGAVFTDKVYDTREKAGSDVKSLDGSHYVDVPGFSGWTCPAGHSKEYCAGWQFGWL